MCNKKFDIIVVGGSLVGSALSIGLIKSGFSVAIIEKLKLLKFHKNEPDIRVSAINITSVNFLKKLGVWSFIEKIRCNPYKILKTWNYKKAYVSFSSKLLNLKELGYMIENNVLKYALWETLKKNEVNFYFSELTNIIYNNKNWTVELSNGKKLYAKLIVGADGIYSKVRKLSNIKYKIFKYDYDCIVFSVKNKFISGHITWQKFDFYGGIYAFLPLYKNWCSLVWYDSKNNIKKINTLEKNDLKLEVAKNFFSENKKKDFSIVNKKVFLLNKLYVKSYIKEGIALVGDAAHAINPIAGQGVNLGYKDVKVLIKILTEAKNNNKLWYSKEVLQKYQDIRYCDNFLMQNSIDVFHDIFVNKFFPIKIIRNFSMFLLQRNNFLKKKFLSYALGLDK